MSEHTRGMWWYLCVGGAHHGGWREIDQSWFHFDTVNLPRWLGSGWSSSSLGIDSYSRRRVMMDADGSYMYVLVCGPWPFASLVMSVWNMLEVQAEQSRREDCPAGWPMVGGWTPDNRGL